MFSGLVGLVSGNPCASIIKQHSTLPKGVHNVFLMCSLSSSTLPSSNCNARARTHTHTHTHTHHNTHTHGVAQVSTMSVGEFVGEFAHPPDLSRIGVRVRMWTSRTLYEFVGEVVGEFAHPPGSGCGHRGRCMRFRSGTLVSFDTVVGLF